MPQQDAFTHIHKAMRTLVYKMGSAMQSADFSEASAVPSLVDEVNRGLEMLEQHADAEDRFLFHRLLDAAEEPVRTAEGHHKEIHAKVEAMRKELHAVAIEQDPVCRIETSERLNRELDSLLAFYLTHMCFEEEWLRPLVLRLLKEEEVLGIQREIQKYLPPERYAEFLKLMIISMNNVELAGLLSGVKASAPPAAVQVFVQQFEQVLPPAQMQVLRERVGV